MNKHLSEYVCFSVDAFHNFNNCMDTHVSQSDEIPVLIIDLKAHRIPSKDGSVLLYFFATCIRVVFLFAEIGSLIVLEEVYDRKRIEKAFSCGFAGNAD